MGHGREEWLASTLVELADTLVAEFDMVDFLSLLAQRCVNIASSSERSRILELFELQNEEGPCLDAFHSGEQIINVPLADGTGR